MEIPNAEDYMGEEIADAIHRILRGAAKGTALRLLARDEVDMRDVDSMDDFVDSFVSFQELMEDETERLTQYIIDTFGIEIESADTRQNLQETIRAKFGEYLNRELLSQMQSLSGGLSMGRNPDDLLDML